MGVTSISINKSFRNPLDIFFFVSKKANVNSNVSEDKLMLTRMGVTSISKNDKSLFSQILLTCFCELES